MVCPLPGSNCRHALQGDGQKTSIARRKFQPSSAEIPPLSPPLYPDASGVKRRGRDAATRDSRLERIASVSALCTWGRRMFAHALWPRFPGSGLQESVGSRRNTLSYSRSHAYFHIRLHQKESGWGKKNFTRSEPRKNQCFASSCQPARNSRNCLCVALLPPADHVSTFFLDHL